MRTLSPRSLRILGFGILGACSQRESPPAPKADIVSEVTPAASAALPPRETAAPLLPIASIVAPAFVPPPGRRVLAADQAPAYDLASDGAYVYWRAHTLDDPHDDPRGDEANTVRRVALAGGPPEEVLPLDSLGISIESFVVDGDEIFALIRRGTGALIVSRPRDGKGPTRRLLEVQGEVESLTTDSKQVYYTSYPAPKVWALPKAGGAARVVAELKGARDVRKLARQGGDLLVAATVELARKGQILRVSIASGAALPLAPTRVLSAFTTTETEVFWLDGEVGGGPHHALWRVPLVGGATVKVAAVKGEAYASGLAADAHHVYWIAAEREIFRARRGGSLPERVLAAKALRSVCRVEGTLLWIEGEDGDIAAMKL